MTTTTETAPLQDVLQGLKVIDADTHITEPADLWTSRVPARYKDRVPYIKTVNGVDRWYLGDMDFASTGGNVVQADGTKKYGTFYVDSFEQIDRAAYEIQPRLKMMDRLGIYAQIVYPNAIGFSSNKFMRIEDPEVRNLCITVYNDAMAEFQRESDDRIFPQAILPFWDMDVMLAEMRRAKEELKLTGFCVTDRPDSFDIPDLGDSHWDPFWEMASDLGMPINFHIGSGAKDARNDPNRFDGTWESLGPQRRMAVNSANLYMSNARIISNIIMSDLLDRFPGLKFVSVESGIGWIPFVLEGLEYQLDEMVTTGRTQKRRPKEYFRDHVYACFWFEDFGPRNMIEEVGVQNILFETDFPHPTCLYPRHQEHVASVLSDLDPYVRRRVLQDNALELYKLPITVS